MRRRGSTDKGKPPSVTSATSNDAFGGTNLNGGWETDKLGSDSTRPARNETDRPSFCKGECRDEVDADDFCVGVPLGHLHRKQAWKRV